MLAGATEAVLGAVFTDAGFDVAQALVGRWLKEPLRTLATSDRSWKDPRSLLQEQVQRDLGQTPVYGVARRAGPAHEPTFVVGGGVGEQVVGRGQGRSKREASRKAAEHALIEQLQTDEGEE